MWVETDYALRCRRVLQRRIKTFRGYASLLATFSNTPLTDNPRFSSALAVAVHTGP